VLYPLSLIRPELCKNYEYRTFDDWTTIPSALIMRKERRDILDAMNVIVSERMSFVNDYVQSISLNKQCSELLFSDFIPDSKYSPLQLVKISGVFVFLFFFLSFSFFLFLFELAFVWWRPKLKTFRFVIRFSETLSLDRQALILTKYSKMCELVANEKGHL
jgi:hypothetical protein